MLGARKCGMQAESVSVAALSCTDGCDNFARSRTGGDVPTLVTCSDEAPVPASHTHEHCQARICSISAVRTATEVYRSEVRTHVDILASLVSIGGSASVSTVLIYTDAAMPRSTVEQRNWN